MEAVGRLEWQRTAREFLVVAVQPAPDLGGKAAAWARKLAEKVVRLSSGSRRRSHAGAAVVGLDFWKPVPWGGEEPRGDLLDLYLELADRVDWHPDLIETGGMAGTPAQRRPWLERLGPLLQDILPEPGAPLLLPPRGGDAYRGRFLVQPRDLVARHSPWGFLDGRAVFRLLLWSLADRYDLGVIFLVLPDRWGVVGPLVTSNLSDVVVLAGRFPRGKSSCPGFWKGVWERMEQRRRRSQRPAFEEELTIHLGGRGPARAASPVTLYPHGPELPSAAALGDLATHLDVLAATKEAGIRVEVQPDPHRADRRLRQGLLKLEQRDRRKVRILVEQGPYGELPIKALAEETMTALGELGGVPEGFALEVVPVGHQQLLDEVLGGDAALKERLAGVDVLTFPHYMLGNLADRGLLVPWHALASAAGGTEDPPPSEPVIEGGFHLVSSTCRFNGVLFALPYSLLQKVLLVRREHVGEVPTTWSQLLDRVKAAGGGNPGIYLETDTTHVGAWYDWLEVVLAHGGTDFAPPAGAGAAFRGSDYGECHLNQPATVRGTRIYLELLRHLRPAFPEALDWDGLLEAFLRDEASALAVAWSDIVAYHWGRGGRRLGLGERVEIFPLPVDAPGSARSSVEAWVLGVPRLEGREERWPAATLFLQWFLDPWVQRRYAACGGNTGRRDIGPALGPVQRQVHRNLLLSLHRPAPKATFREAPAVVHRIRTWLHRQVERPDTGEASLEAQMDALVRDVVREILGLKVRYVPPRGRGVERPMEGSLA